MNQLPALGAAFEGGFFGDRFTMNGQVYGVIWAPKSLGQTKGTWLPTYTAVPAARSCVDSMANTVAMAEAGSEIAKWALGLDIDGRKDWCIPARDILELAYRRFKPSSAENAASFRDGDNASSIPVGYPYTEELPAQTEIEAFRDGGPEAFDQVYHWSSTQYSEDLAFFQGFYDGYQHGYDEEASLSVRAVRLIQLTA
ncbi:MAG: hypothetical protein ABI605_11045 [Rhizobacter sp.]